MKQDTKHLVLLQIVLAIMIVCVYCIHQSLGPTMKNTQLAMGILLIMEIVWAAWLFYKKKLTTDAIVSLIIIAGIIMRIGYMLYTPFNVRSHDVGEVDIDAYGHAAYLLKLVIHHTLPETNTVQLYQQPFFYIIGACISKGINLVLPTNGYRDYVDAAKVVSCFASCGILLFSKRICETFGLEKKGAILATALIAFVPDFYLLSSRTNADALICYLMLIAFLMTIEWYQNPGWKNTILLAVVYGLGMMTKISMATMAILTATIFILKLVRSEKVQRLRLIPKFAVFGVISLPLGLWYCVRNYLLFDQALTYVPDIGKDLDIYIGNYSFPTRLLTFSFENYFKTPYAYPWEDFNEPVYLLKSAMFGEFVYDITGVIPTLLLFFALVVSILSMIQLVATIRKKEKATNDWYIILLIGIMLFSIVTFAIQYPYGCSMDFRYYVILIIPFGVLLGRAPAHCFMKTAIPLFVTLMSICSCLMYLMIR